MQEHDKYSCYSIANNWLVLLCPEVFARPGKQKVLAKAHGYEYAFKQLLVLELSNAFPMGRAFACKHLLVLSIWAIDFIHRGIF